MVEVGFEPSAGGKDEIRKEDNQGEEGRRTADIPTEVAYQ
jgi:hypothetical protein